jgi:hypothetical protein
MHGFVRAVVARHFESTDVQVHLDTSRAATGTLAVRSQLADSG